MNKLMIVDNNENMIMIIMKENEYIENENDNE